MYKAIGINEYGQVYNQNGLLDQYKEKLESSIKEFDSLNEAKEYAIDFIKTYPQVRFEIFNNKELIEEVLDEEYWLWKEKNAKEWEELTKKGEKLQNIILIIFLCILGIFLAIISHFTSNISIYVKIIAFPIFTVIGWHVINRIFARIC